MIFASIVNDHKMSSVSIRPSHWCYFYVQLITIPPSFKIYPFFLYSQHEVLYSYKNLFQFFDWHFISQLDLSHSCVVSFSTLDTFNCISLIFSSSRRRVVFWYKSWLAIMTVSVREVQCLKRTQKSKRCPFIHVLTTGISLYAKILRVW